jgi:hypothetical protein
MKKNLYYKNHFGRKNIIKEFFLNLAYSFASFARMPLEIFTRRNFGERYFSFAQTVVFAVFMSLFPIVYIKVQDFAFGGMGAGMIVAKFATWYLFLGTVVKASLKRKQEIKRLPSVFDFARFSLSTGELLPVIRDFAINGKKLNIRTVETLIEPSIFLIAGITLAILAQPIGYFIIVCSVLYSLSYVMAYHIGDNYIMDIIDNIICAEELEDVFVNDKSPRDARGFQDYGRKPSDPDMRRKVADGFFENEEPIFAV